ncbi:MAG: phenylalanine--tRNA ligase subunit beta [Acidimicrobiia bacterium]
MKVPLRWLQEFIDLPTDDIDEISYAFDMLGLTVEGTETHEVRWTDVYVGQVLEISAHPDADKVRVCQVDTGSGPEQIICGAWNFEAGAYVPVAKPGAVLPGGMNIGQRTIRGVISNGMICSERELDLGEDHAGIMVLDGEPALGLAFGDLVELPDVVFELDVTPNRPDALSIAGVARDLAAWFDVEYTIPVVEMPTVSREAPIRVVIADPTGCRRFTAREISGVTVGTSPLWMRHRLHKVGVRSISNVVDVTNYVMFELGHPLHAFDADSIEGERLIVKRATKGETLVTLDGEERLLNEDDLIIYDDAGPTSMSGTMGGLRSEVTPSTSRVLMEAASWDPPTIMHMWRRYDLRSEAATRFERGVDPNLAEVANRRASAMVRALAGGEILEGAVDQVAIDSTPVEIELAVHDVERLLGSGFTAQHVSEILQRLGMEVDGVDPMRVVVPTFRPDVTRKADLVEEIARIHGFDKFEATLPTGPSGGLTREQRNMRTVQSSLSGIGLDQAINLPFVNPEDLESLGMETDERGLLTIKNPLRDEESKLRPTMLPALLNSLRFNRSHGAATVALFEVGRVFSPEVSGFDDRLPVQTDRLAWAATGATGLRFLDGSHTQFDGAVSLAIWRRLSSDLRLSGVEPKPAAPPGFHPRKTAALWLSGRLIGHVGELAPASARAFDLEDRVAIAELDLEPLLAVVEPHQVEVPSVYPFVDFDLSFVMDSSAPVGDVLDVTRSAGGDLVEDLSVFDEFKGLDEGKKAVAIHYRLRAPDRTLTNEEVAPVRQKMISAAESLGATLRGA